MVIGLKMAEMVLPVILMLAAGYMCKRKRFFDEGGLAGLKAVISHVTLPVVLFQAFLTAEYNLHVLLVFAVVYCGFGAALLAGYGLRRFASPYGRFAPFLMTCAEGGMLGYALYGLIAGKENTYLFAMVDIGQTVFAYTVFLSMLKVTDGGSVSPKEILHNVLTNKACIGMLAGIVLGVSGAGKLILGSPVGGIAESLMAFVTAPTAGIILIIVGYELSLDRELLGPVLKTVALRLAVYAVILTAASAIIFHIIPFDKKLFMALLVMYSLPAPFIIPLYADVKEDGGYISSTLSVGTLVLVALYAGIVGYSLI